MPKIGSKRYLRMNKIHGKSWICCDSWKGSPHGRCPICGSREGQKASAIRRFMRNSLENR